MSSTAILLPFPRAVFYDANGNPLAAGFVWTYIPNTTTPKTTWQDPAQATPNQNPILLDANGSCLLYGSGTYQLTVLDALGNSVPAYSGFTSVALSQVDFLTIAQLRANNAAVVEPAVVYVAGYSTAADGGQGNFVYKASDQTTADNGGTIIVDAFGNRWYRDTQGSPFDVKWFGAKGDGATDDLAAINACITAAAAAVAGGVFFPGDRYLISNTIAYTGNNLWFRGADRGATTIVCSFATGDIFQIGNPGSSATNPNNVRISDMSITSSVAKTSGAAIHFTNGHNLQIDNVRFDLNLFWGVFFEGGAGQFIYRMLDFEINSGHNGIVIGSTLGLVQDITIRDGNIASQTVVGLQLVAVSGGWIENIDIIGGGVGVQTLAPAPLAVVAVWFRGISADTCADNGWQLWTAGGVLTDVVLESCWCSDCGTNPALGLHGVVVDPKTGGIDGLTFDKMIVQGNAGEGYAIVGGLDISIVNGQTWCNSTAGSGLYNGIHVFPNVSSFSILGGFSGLGGINAGSGNLQGWGVLVGAGTSDLYIVADIICFDNVTGTLSDGGTGQNKRLDVMGFLYPAITAPAVPATGVFVQNNTGFDCMVYPFGGTISGATIDPANVAAAGPGPYYLPAKSEISLTYTGTVTSWAWQAVGLT